MINGRQLALLRGINVGGRHLIGMPALTRLFTDLGCSGVSSYIQSGNVLFTPPEEGFGAERVSRAMEERFGFAVPVVLRSQAQLTGIVAANPLATPVADPKLLHVVFLAKPLDAEPLAFLRAQVAGEEQLAARGNELYLFTPHGTGRSKLALGCVASKQPATNTMRNWQTVLKLAELLGF